MARTILLAIWYTVAIFAGTGLLLGAKKARALPGGVVAAALCLHPVYVSVPVALMVHFLIAVIVRPREIRN